MHVDATSNGIVVTALMPVLCQSNADLMRRARHYCRFRHNFFMSAAYGEVFLFILKRVFMHRIRRQQLRRSAMFRAQLAESSTAAVWQKPVVKPAPPAQSSAK